MAESIPPIQPNIQMAQINIPADSLSAIKDWTQLILEFLKEKPKECGKVIGYTCAWLTEIIPDLPSSVKEPSYFMKDMKNFISTLETPEKMIKFHDAVITLFSGKDPIANEPVGLTQLIIHRARQVIKEGSSMILSMCDGTDLSSHFIPISSEVLQTVKTVNLGSTLIGCGNSAIENVQKIANQPEYNEERTTLNLINLARDVSYVALAIFGLGALITGTIASPVIMLACVTSGLLFTIGGFFYERIVDPEKKGMNIPNTVIDNFKREVARSRTAA